MGTKTGTKLPWGLLCVPFFIYLLCSFLCTPRYNHLPKPLLRVIPPSPLPAACTPPVLGFSSQVWMWLVQSLYLSILHFSQPQPNTAVQLNPLPKLTLFHGSYHFFPCTQVQTPTFKDIVVLGLSYVCLIPCKSGSSSLCSVELQHFLLNKTDFQPYSHSPF